jgi:ribosomal protein S27AE
MGRSVLLCTKRTSRGSADGSQPPRLFGGVLNIGEIIVQTDRGCPKCGATEVVLRKDQELACSTCGSVLGHVSRLCSSCGHYNQDGLRQCSSCGTELVRECTSCGADNWVLATYCSQCGRNLGIIERLARRSQQTTQERLYQRKATMSSLKEREEWASQMRMSSIMDLERLQLESLAASPVTKEVGDQLLLRILAVIAALLFIAAVLGLLLTAGAV